MMTDPIADMLTRLRNAATAGHRWVDMPVSKLKIELARLLKENAFVFDYKVLDDGAHGLLRIYLKYSDGYAGDPAPGAGLQAGPPTLRRCERDSPGPKRLGDGHPLYLQRCAVRPGRSSAGCGWGADGLGLVTGKQARLCRGLERCRWRSPKGWMSPWRVGPSPPKDPKGTLSLEIHPEIEVKVEEALVVVHRPSDQPRHKALHGLVRSLVANMVTGVSEGFSKTLEIVGVGYRADPTGRDSRFRWVTPTPSIIPRPTASPWRARIRPPSWFRAPTNRR